MKRLPEFDKSKMIVNPFSISLTIPVTHITDTTQYKPDSKGIMQPVEYYLDRREHVKLYHFAGLKDVVSQLSPAALSLFMHIAFRVESGCDYVQINQEYYMHTSNVKSVNTFKKAVKDLIRYAFISQSPDCKDVYWINPAYFFNGNPITKYPNNLEIRSETTKK